jgi:hypothetical protein
MIVLAGQDGGAMDELKMAIRRADEAESALARIGDQLATAGIAPSDIWLGTVLAVADLVGQVRNAAAVLDEEGVKGTTLAARVRALADLANEGGGVSPDPGRLRRLIHENLRLKGRFDVIDGEIARLGGPRYTEAEVSRLVTEELIRTGRFIP